MAAAAAVNAYLEQESAIAPAPRAAATVGSPWKASGRAEIMQMRSLWQRRILPR